MKMRRELSPSKHHKDKLRELGAVRSAAQTSSGLYVKSRAGLKLRDGMVSTLALKVRRAMPWLQDSDHPAVRAWAQLEILADSVFAILRDKGVTSNGVEPRRLLDDFRKLRGIQLAYAQALGMTPAARLAIKASRDDGAFDLASHVASNGHALTTDSGRRSKRSVVDEEEVDALEES